jgi:hypothetical protein
MAPERVNFRKTKAPAKDPRGRIQVSPELLEEMDDVMAELREVRPAYALSKTQIAEAGIKYILGTIRRDIAAFRET